MQSTLSSGRTGLVPVLALSLLIAAASASLPLHHRIVNALTGEGYVLHKAVCCIPNGCRTASVLAAVSDEAY